MSESAVIIGAGAGLSASLARLCHQQGMQVVMAARNTDKLADLAAETGAHVLQCDVADPASVAGLFEATDDLIGTPDFVVFNPSARVRGPVIEIDADAVRNAIMVSAYGGFLVVQQAAQRMQKRGSGTIALTGASASVKGYANSSCFAMGKFGLRGLAQSSARELAPQGVHV